MKLYKDLSPEQALGLAIVEQAIKDIREGKEIDENMAFLHGKLAQCVAMACEIDHDYLLSLAWRAAEEYAKETAA